MDQTTIRVFLVGSLFAMAMFVFATVYANRGVSAAELARLTERQDKAIVCLLVQLNDHRLNTHASHTQLEKAHRLSTTPPAPPPAPDLHLPEDACQEYFAK